MKEGRVERNVLVRSAVFSNMQRESHGFAGMDGVETMGCANMGK